MSNSTNRSKFKCPKCLSDIVARADQAGARIECPSCKVTLTVPNTVAAQDLFDDLFEEPEQPKPVKEKRPKQPRPVPAEVTFPEPESKQIQFDTETPPEQSNISISGEDPFKYDESKALRIEGISDNLRAADAFYFSCPICDSKIQAKESQIGEKVKCTDCYSKVLVAKPKKDKHRIDPWKMPAKLKTGDEDEFKLEDPVERPQIDYSVDPEFGLGNVKDDLLAPRLEPDDAELIDNNTDGGQQNRIRQTKTRHTKPQAIDQTTGEKQPAARPRLSKAAQPKSKPERRSSRPIKAVNMGAKTVNTAKPIELRHVFRLDLSRDVDLLIRTVVTVVFLTMFFTLSHSVWKTLAQEDLNWGEKFVNYFPALLGAFVCLLVACWFLAVTFSVLMRTVANGFTRVEEWVGFAPSEWAGSCAIVAFSGWAALLPGVLAGYLAWQVTGWFLFLPVFAAVSAFALVPLFLISSFYNESVVNILSSEVIKTFSDQGGAWVVGYKLFAVALGLFLLGIVIVFIPSLLFSFIGATIQVLAITLLAVLVGLHARGIIASIN